MVLCQLLDLNWLIISKSISIPYCGFPRLSITFQIAITSRESIIHKLINGDVPLGVSSKQIEHPNLEYQDFFSDPVILIAPADHPWAKFRKVYPDDLLDEPIILREELAGSREVLMDGLHAHDISEDMLNIAMVLGNAEAIEMAVEEGLGIAFVSRLAASRGLELGRIVEVEVEGMQLMRNIYLVRNRIQPFTRAQSEFWQFIKDTRLAIKLKTNKLDGEACE